MDAAIAAIIAAAIGGITGLLSSTIPLMVSRRTLEKQLEADLRRAKIGILIGKRQEALETLWFTLSDHSDPGAISYDQRRSYISATLWAPQRLRTLCLQALSFRDKTRVNEARAELIKAMEEFDEG